MSDQTTEPRPIVVDRVAVNGEYYGVKVADLGEECESVLAFTHDRRRAIAATRCHIRKYHGEIADVIDPNKPKYVQIFDHCGCPPIENDDDKGLDCDRWGLPPCRDDFGWMTSTCEPGDENAIAVTELDWSC